MPMLHDASARAEIIERIRGLRPDSSPRWGRMSVDQALWHLNQALLVSLGQLQARPRPMPLRFVAKPIAVNVRWPRNEPNAPEFEAVSPHDFASERRRHLQMLEDFARRPLEARYPAHPVLGSMTGREWSRMHYRHLDHHLKQFGA